VIEETPDTDEQYEGCLSFFRVRGQVPRPLVLHVEHQDISGQRAITVFERGVARLVAHEIDHLNGVLYTDRMRPGVEPIPVAEYRQGGQQWTYE
jgi:peptide deformylase